MENTPTESFPAELEQARLPMSFVLAFFAALTSVIGTIIYEIFAPQLVKSFSRNEYVERQVAHYHSSPTDHQIEASVEFLQANNKRRLAIICRMVAQQSKPQVFFEDEALYKPLNGGFPFQVTNLKPFANELLTAEAEERYDLAAYPMKAKQNAKNSNKLFLASSTAAAWSLAMFAIAGGAVLAILVIQAVSVLSAAGLV